MEKEGKLTAIVTQNIDGLHQKQAVKKYLNCMAVYGEIIDVPENMTDELINALKYIKRLGQNRNRGLGRCTISIEKGGMQ